MGITFPGQLGTEVYVAGTGGQTINLPGSPVENDLIVHFISNTGDAFPSITTAGYTTQDSYDNAFLNKLFWKKMTSSPDTTAVVPTNAGWASYPVLTWCLRGAHATPSDAAVVKARTDLVVPNGPAITTVTDLAAVLSVCAYSGGFDAGGAPSGYSAYCETVFATSRGAGGAWKIKTPAGSEDPGDFTGMASCNALNMMTWAVAPAAAGGGIVCSPLNGCIVRGARRVGRVVAAAAVVAPSLHQVLHYGSKVA